MKYFLARRFLRPSSFNIVSIKIDQSLLSLFTRYIAVR